MDKILDLETTGTSNRETEDESEKRDWINDVVVQCDYEIVKCPGSIGKNYDYAETQLDYQEEQIYKCFTRSVLSPQSSLKTFIRSKQFLTSFSFA